MIVNGEPLWDSIEKISSGRDKFESVLVYVKFFVVKLWCVHMGVFPEGLEFCGLQQDPRPFSIINLTRALAPALRPRVKAQRAIVAIEECKCRFKCKIKEGYDPNGIRTRVTAVKGRCPRPLDDRVRKAGPISEAATGVASYLRALNKPPVLQILNPR